MDSLQSEVMMADGSKKPRCQARLSYGTVWQSGRQQCGKGTKPGEVFCGTHLRQRKDREDRRSA